MTVKTHFAENRKRGDFPLVAKAARTSYSIEIPADKFCALEQYASNIIHYGLAGVLTLCQRLDKETPALEIEHYAFFGSYVFYTLNKKDDFLETHNKIVSIIEEFIKEAQEYDADTALAGYINGDE